jgi:hypothetical protein
VGSYLTAENSHYMRRYIYGVLDRIVVGKDSNTFLNAVSNDRLNGYDNGFGSG